MSKKHPKKSHFARDNNISDTRKAIDLVVQMYLDHSSINRIKTTSKNQISSITSSSNACGTNPEEIFELLSALDIKKAVGFDMIPLKLVKIAASVLCQPLSIAINNSLSKGIFPDDAKIAMVSPLDKGTKKNDISNFRPVSILTTFSKIYERVTKKLIDKAMGKYLSPLISAYRQNYSTQHVLIRLLEEWREGLDNNFVVGGVFVDCSKDFDCIKVLMTI